MDKPNITRNDYAWRTVLVNIFLLAVVGLFISAARPDSELVLPNASYTEYLGQGVASISIPLGIGAFVTLGLYLWAYLLTKGSPTFRAKRCILIIAWAVIAIEAYGTFLQIRDSKTTQYGNNERLHRSR